MKAKLFLHACCAPDALYVISLLKDEYDLTVFFYNPNIHPQEEYVLRFKDMEKVARWTGTPLLEGGGGLHEADLWLRRTAPFKGEPEKGRRCDVCYALRLAETARQASGRKYDMFGTVMSLSPWKKAEVLNRIGRMLGRRFHIPFLEADFKKKDGFQKSVHLSRNLGLYRQDYCGCIYSLEEARARKEGKK